MMSLIVGTAPKETIDEEKKPDLMPLMNKNPIQSVVPFVKHRGVGEIDYSPNLA